MYRASQKTGEQSYPTSKLMMMLRAAYRRGGWARGCLATHSPQTYRVPSFA